MAGPSSATDPSSARERVLEAVARGEPLKGGYLIWNLTDRCLNRCQFCQDESGRAETGAVVTRETFRRVAEEARDEGFRELFLSGGEPGLLAELPDLVSIARDSKLAVAMFTSGAGGKATLDRIVRARPLRVTVSIDAAAPAVHDRLRGRAGAYADACLAVRELSRCPGIQVDLHAVVTRDNADDLGGVVVLARRHGIRHLAVSLVLDAYGRDRAALRLTKPMMLRFVCETIPRLMELAGADVVVRPLPVPMGAVALLANPHELSGYLVQHRESTDLRDEIELWASGHYNRAFLAEYGCLLPLRDLTIEPNGDVYPCSASTAFRPDHVVGNVHQDSLATIRRSSTLRAFYRDLRQNDCCARCHACSNMSDGSYLVRSRPDAVPASLWPALAYGNAVAPC